MFFRRHVGQETDVSNVGLSSYAKSLSKSGFALSINDRTLFAEIHQSNRHCLAFVTVKQWLLFPCFPEMTIKIAMLMMMTIMMMIMMMMVMMMISMMTTAERRL